MPSSQPRTGYDALTTPAEWVSTLGVSRFSAAAGEAADSVFDAQQRGKAAHQSVLMRVPHVVCENNAPRGFEHCCAFLQVVCAFDREREAVKIRSGVVRGFGFVAKCFGVGALDREKVAESVGDALALNLGVVVIAVSPPPF